jgi:hypothetical protein
LASGKLLTFTYMREQEVWAWSEHESPGGRYRSVSVIREGAEDNVYFIVQRGDKFFIEYQVRRGYGDPVEKSFFVDCGLSYDNASKPISHVTGLKHLAGKKVVALADGSVVRDILVSEDGEVDLPYPSGVIAIGLPYEMEVETLDPEVRADNGTTVGDKKAVVRAVVMLRESRGLEVGPDRSKLIPLKFPMQKTWGGALPLFSGELDIALPGAHRTEATIVMRQRDPLPVTVLAVVTHISVG